MAQVLAARQLPLYLKRVGLSHAHGVSQPSLAGLSQVQWQHMQHIPFENLSLRNAKAAKAFKPSTKLEDLMAKLVLGNRGGYCFEMNGLLGAALRGLEYDILDGGARVAAPSDDMEASDVFHTSGHDHHILFVALEDGALWLVDVGFGSESPPLPIKLPFTSFAQAAEAASQGQHWWGAEECWGGLASCDWAQELPVDRVCDYRLRLGLPGTTLLPTPANTRHFVHRVGFYLQKKRSTGTYKDLYFFRLGEFIPQDFAMLDHYIQTSPDSHFVTNLLVALHTPQGRCTISNDDFREFRKGEEVREEKIESEEQLERLLAEHFGIRL